MPQNSFIRFAASAFKKNLIPAFILQCFALSIALSYAYWPQTHPVFDFFAELRNDYAWHYAALSTAFFGGLLPFLFLAGSGRINKYLSASLFFYLVLWAIKGVEVNFLYQLQNILFGDNNAPTTVIKKVAFDQFIYSAFWAAPSIMLSNIWRDNDFNWQKTRAAWCETDLWAIRIPAAIISNWLIWIPATAIILAAVL